MSDVPRCEPPAELRGRDGWHWVKCGDDGREFVARWSAAPHSGLEPLWARYGESATPVWAAAHWDWRYLSHVATPAEVEELREERDALREEKADLVEEVETVLRQRATLRAEVERLRAALGFYACIDHYPVHHAEAPDVVRNDGGKVARAALEPKP